MFTTTYGAFRTREVFYCTAGAQIGYPTFLMLLAMPLDAIPNVEFNIESNLVAHLFIERFFHILHVPLHWFKTIKNITVLTWSLLPDYTLFV